MIAVGLILIDSAIVDLITVSMSTVGLGTVGMVMLAGMKGAKGVVVSDKIGVARSVLVRMIAVVPMYIGVAMLRSAMFVATVSAEEECGSLG